MKIDFNMADRPEPHQVKVGMVYPVKGGQGRRYGHMFVIIAITKEDPQYGTACLMLRIDKMGEPVGVTSYGLHYVEGLQPIAFAEGVDQWTMTIRGLG